MKPDIIIYTDGACRGNPGPGGWAAILDYHGHQKEIFGSSKYTTNNRMELTAVISAISSLKKPCNVIVYTDSTYVASSMNEGYVTKWKDSRWLKKNKPIPNADLWEKLIEVSQPHQIIYAHVKGHAGHPQNERCDQLAVAAALNI